LAESGAETAGCTLTVSAEDNSADEDALARNALSTAVVSWVELDCPLFLTGSLHATNANATNTAKTNFFILSPFSHVMV
jgi:hypothetical protein